MESKKKLLEWFRNNLKDESKFTLEEFANACLEISNEAKKEMFDDLDKYSNFKCATDAVNFTLYIKEMRKRHLSTFAKNDIIADTKKSDDFLYQKGKQNPQDDITLCSICNCMTKTSMDGYCMKCAADKQFT